MHVGDKAVLFHQLHGAPFSLTAGASLSQDKISGYLFSELIATREANNWLSLKLNPKLVRARNCQPFYMGLSANIQPGDSFRLIPEMNIDAEAIPPPMPSQLSAVRPIDVGQLLENVDDIQVGTRILFSFNSH